MQGFQGFKVWGFEVSVVFDAALEDGTLHEGFIGFDKRGASGFTSVLVFGFRVKKKWKSFQNPY